MTEEIENDQAPIDDYTFKRMLKEGVIPSKLQKGSREVDYDLKFYWQNGIKAQGSYNYKVYFGNYFRNPKLKVESMTIGPGKPFKTDSIVVLLDPPKSEKAYSITVYDDRPDEKGKATRFAPGSINSKALIELFLKTAEEMGIHISQPKKPGEILSIHCTLIPYVRNGVEDLKTCIVRIDNTDYRK